MTHTLHCHLATTLIRGPRDSDVDSSSSDYAITAPADASPININQTTRIHESDIWHAKVADGRMHLDFRCSDSPHAIKGYLLWVFHARHLGLNCFRGFIFLIYVYCDQWFIIFSLSHSLHIASSRWIPHGCTAHDCMTADSRCFSAPHG